MRILALLAVPVAAWDLTYFSDEVCGEASPDVKGENTKNSLSQNTLTLGRPGECVEFAEEIEMKTDASGAGDLASLKFKFGKVISCNEYGSTNFELYPKAFKECKYLKDEAVLSAGGMVQGLSGQNQIDKTKSAGWKFSVFGTSFCQPIWSGQSTFGWHPLAPLSNADKTLGSYKVNCNPAPADIWAIVLGSLAIAFSFVGIGLGAVAMKK